MNPEKWMAPLEYDVLSVMWEHGELSVARVRDELSRKGKPLALTTVSTVLDRLYKKGLVERRIEKSGGIIKYIYWPKVAKQEYERGLVSGLLDGLLDKMAEPTVSRLMELMAEDDKDREVLSRYLEKLKREKKR
ncbi:MAG: BlaI/MecI/CopY family transcriptional regulator [Candidatus Marsarchaeota archaeon]